MSARGEGVPLDDPFGGGVAVAGRERRREHVVTVEQRAQLTRLRDRQDPGVEAALVLERHALLELRDVGLAREDEQVPDLLELDLPTRAPAEVAKCGEAALGDLDVEHVRELRSDTAGGLGRRAAAELGALDQHDVDAGLGEVKGGARADHPAADDDHGRGLGEGRNGTWHQAALLPEHARQQRRERSVQRVVSLAPAPRVQTPYPGSWPFSACRRGDTGPAT